MLASFARRIQAINEEIAAKNAEKSEIFREARRCDINVRAFKEALRRLKQDAEQVIVIDEYLRAMGFDPNRLRNQGFEPSNVVGGHDGFPSDLPDTIGGE